MMEEIRALHPDLYPIERYPDLFGNEKAPALFDFNIDLIIMGALTPSIGDERGIGEPKRHRAYRYSNIAGHNIFAFTKYGDPRYARASTRMESRTRRRRSRPRSRAPRPSSRPAAGCSTATEPPSSNRGRVTIGTQCASTTRRSGGLRPRC